MRILAINHDYTVSGSTHALLNLAEHWRRSGHEVTGTAAQSASGPIRDEYLRRGFPLAEVPSPGGFDVCVCNTILTAPQVLVLARAMPTIWWLHEAAVGIDLLLQNPGWVAAFREAGAIVFPIEFLRDTVYRSFIYGLELSRICIVPNGIPPAGISPRAVDPNRTEIEIVSVGSIYPRKRHPDLIRAVAALDHLPVRCTLIGQLHTLPEDCWTLMAARPGRFVLAGELSHAKTLAAVKAADIFCLPSGSEVQPHSLLEAAMLERPPVLSNLPVYGGTWAHGHNCLMHPVASVEMLTHELALLATNPALRQRLGAAAQRTVAGFSEAAFFARFDAVLASLTAVR